MPLLLGVLVLCGMLLISHWPPVLVGLTILGIFVVSFVGAHLIFGGRAVLHLGRKGLHWRKCRHCTGGAQWLNSNGSGWGPVPEKIRIVQDGHEFFEPPQGNIRTCPHCQLGGHWYDPSDRRGD